jgi:aminopeptidase N
MQQVFILLFILLVGCRTDRPSLKNPADPHSFSNPADVAITHLVIHLTVNFNEKQLSGFAEYTLKNKTRSRWLKLDTRQLYIEKAEADGQPARFELGPADSILGRCLTVSITPETRKVRVYYHTMPEAEALQWLSPSQTAGGEHPFLFTQSQAILARTWVPVQDAPQIRFTYVAEITCPPSLMALMSAENDTVVHADGVYRFNMPQPVPAYLLALAVGHLRYHAFDHRCGIYSEPELLPQAIYEFAPLPAMMDSVSQLYGPYRWQRFDVLVLPPSFPFGGMENPRLTFLSPTILSGDRSLISILAHELAHSWSGNLVTSATWNDFWLNEGFTTYLELRIMEKIYGKPYADMLSRLGWDELMATLQRMEMTHADTRLYLDLSGRNPDEAVTDIAYEKGRLFLTLIEQTIGRQTWDAFLKNYFDDHAFTSVSTPQFEKYLSAFLSRQAYEKIKVKEWLYEPGLPDNCPLIHSDELQRAKQAARDFMLNNHLTADQVKGWTPHHYIHFLRSLPDTLTLSQLYYLDQTFGFSTLSNAEIQCQWMQICIRNNYHPAFEHIRDFLLSVGRRKFVLPLYRMLAATDDGRQFARAVYELARPGYHAITRQSIDEVLEWNKNP